MATESAEVVGNWTSPLADEERSLVLALRKLDIVICTIATSAVPSWATDLRAGRDIKGSKIPLSNVAKIIADTTDSSISIKLTERVDGQTDFEFVFPSTAARDEFLDGVERLLGTKWERQVRTKSRIVAAIVPLIVGALIALFTWIMYGDAKLIAAGKKLDERGGLKLRLIRKTAHWVERQAGPNGILAIGGLCGVGCFAWMVSVIIQPGERMLIVPKDNDSFYARFNG